MDYWLVSLCGFVLLLLLLGVYIIYRYLRQYDSQKEFNTRLQRAIQSVPPPDDPRRHFKRLSITTSILFKQMSVGDVTDHIYEYMNHLAHAIGRTLHIITFRETDRVHKALCEKNEIYHDFAKTMFHSKDVNYDLHRTKMTDCSKELGEAFHKLNNIATVKEYEDFFNTYDVEVCKQLEALKSGDEGIYFESVKKAHQYYDLLGSGDITKK